ncbi:MAG: hypothetical protein IH933_02075 [Euryarchaeota archaeon]|jgi:hypothetical protein|nr:hypothetical protein [Euryarchaeota archaeon]
MDSPDEPSPPRTQTITGQCERCEWDVVAESYPAMVKAYQDHLRESHPKLWLRT